MTSRVVLWINQSFDSIENNSQLDVRLKQVPELGFENIIINASLALSLISQKSKLDEMIVKGIAYSEHLDVNNLPTLIHFHHDMNCDTAILPEKKSEKIDFIKKELINMGLKIVTNFCTIEDVGETTHKSRLLIKSPIEFNQNPMQSKLVDESKKVKDLINRFMRFKGNNLLLINYPDLSLVDFLKQSKDTLNRLYFLQTT